MHFGIWAGRPLRSALILPLVICTSAKAGSASGATVQMIEMRPGSMVGIITVTGATSPAACATGGRFVIDLKTADGLNAFGLALAAHARGAPVSLSGSGACSLSSGAETATAFTLAKPWSALPAFVAPIVGKHAVVPQ